MWRQLKDTRTIKKEERKKEETQEGKSIEESWKEIKQIVLYIVHW